MRNFLISFCLLNLLTGCATQSVKVMEICPPKNLTAHCRLPDFTGTTVGDLYQWAEVDVPEAMKKCNADKAALRNLCAR